MFFQNNWTRVQQNRNYGRPIRTRVNWVEMTDPGIRSIGTVGGCDVAGTEIRYTGVRRRTAGTLNYPGKPSGGVVADALIP